jgi:hypothetical protein
MRQAPRAVHCLAEALNGRFYMDIAGSGPSVYPKLKHATVGRVAQSV